MLSIKVYRFLLRHLLYFRYSHAHPGRFHPVWRWSNVKGSTRNFLLSLWSSYRARVIASRIRTTRAEFNEGERAKIGSLLLDVRGSWWLMRTNDFNSNNCSVVPKTDDFLLSFPSFSQSAEQSWFFCQWFFPSSLAPHLISLPPFAGKNWKEKKNYWACS